jgi:hypothetical protein
MTTYDLNCRLLCASAAAYLIQPDSKSGQYDPSKGADAGAKAQYDAVGYSAEPWIVSDEIDAVLVGKTVSELIVAFRGTLPPAWNLPSVLDWLNDIILAEPATNANLPGKVHSGFLRTTLTLMDQTVAAIKSLDPSGSLPIYITGHSKGGGVAPIAALYLQRVHHIKAANVVTFAGPKPGDEAFASAYNAEFPQDLRYENYLDLVPLMAPSDTFINLMAEVIDRISPELAALLEKAAKWDYVDIGTLRYIEKSGHVIGDRLFLIEERVGEILEKLVTGNLAAIGDAHHAACHFGYMNGTCAGGVCPPKA